LVRAYCQALSAACSVDDHQSRTVADEDVAGRRCPQRGAAADLKQGTETLARIYMIAQKL
jgi:hypothetical protein